jgi:hypothetical protein
MPKGALFLGRLGSPRTIIVEKKRETRYRIGGVTRDGVTNAPVAGVTVELYESSASDAPSDADEPRGKLRDVTVSDANGAYYFDVTGTEASGLQFKAVAYKAGAPNVAGSTVPTLQGTPVA